MTATTLNIEKTNTVTSLSSIFVDMDTDQSLVMRIMEGDERAFEKLFKSYYVRLCQYAFQYGNSMSDAEELVQDTFVNFWEKRDNLSINTSFKSYIYRAVKNRGLNKIRGDQRRKKYHDQHYDNVISLSKTDDKIQLDDLNEKLYEGLEGLPPKCKRIFQMSRLEGLKHKEIASKMDVKVKTVENQIGIALKYLRKHLREYLQFVALLFSTSNF